MFQETPTLGDSWSLLIPIAVAGVISIATLAVVPVIKALGDIKKQNADLAKQSEEIHKVVNSNFAKQTEELRVANEKIETLLAAAKDNDAKFKSLTEIIEKLAPQHLKSFNSPNRS